MQHLLTTVLVILFGYVLIQAQDCEAYSRLIKEAKSARKSQDYKTAIKKYNLAMLNCPDSLKLIQQEFLTTFNKIDSIKEKAEREKTKADSALVMLLNEQSKNKKFIDEIYFYKDQFALSYKDGKYGLVNKFDEAPIKYKYSSAEQFDTTGFAKVKIKDQNYTIDYLIDTAGKEYTVAYNIENLNNSTEVLDLRSDKSTHFPVEIFKHKQLQDVILGSNMNSLELRGNKSKKLSSLPKRLVQFNNLVELNVSNNELSSLPEKFGELSNLKILNLSKNELSSLPKTLENLQNLQILDLSHNKLETLNEAFGKFKLLVTLNLSNNKMGKLPNIFEHLDSLKNINLSNNQLNDLPSTFSKLINLTNLNLIGNQFNTLPKSISQLKNLTELSLNGNQLVNLPPSIGRLKNLEYLNLSNNKKLTNLPSEIDQLKNLVLLDLSGTRINAFKVKQLQNKLPDCSIRW